MIIWSPIREPSSKLELSRKVRSQAGANEEPSTKNQEPRTPPNSSFSHQPFSSSFILSFHHRMNAPPTSLPSAPTGVGRALVVSLHDVSPRTRLDCGSILTELARLGVPRCS